MSNVFVYLENGLQKEDGSINESLVYYLTNYGVDFTLVTKKSKTALNQWDVSELVSKAGLPRQVADNCVFGATVDALSALAQDEDILFTDDTDLPLRFHGKRQFRFLETMGLAAYCA